MPAKIAVIQFPGSNCEREAMLAVQRAGMVPVPFLWNEKASTLQQCDGFIIIGGFSYEDRSRAGIIAALDPVLKMVQQEIQHGKPLIGICNGAQILVETGLVPGAEHNALVMALAMNRRVQNGKILGAGYYNDWVNVTRGANSKTNAFNRLLKTGDILRMPVAHGEGRYVMPPSTLTLLKENGLIAFQYCDDKANVHEEFPINPNGSVLAIAGICNVTGNVLSLMPHPERSPLCDVIFASMRDYIREGDYRAIEPLKINTALHNLKQYEPQKNSTAFTVDLLITDNEAVSVQTALQQAGIPVNVKRQVHWEITADDIHAAKKQIINSGELFNTNKEMLSEPAVENNSVAVLVRQHEDMIGKSKQQLLSRHFGVKGLHAIHHGVLWHLTPTTTQPVEDIFSRVLKTHLLFNPFAQDGYRFNA